MMREDWPEILNQCIAAARGKPFVWGQHDCCLWVANTVRAMTGTDHAKEFRGKYTSMRGAHKVLGKKGLSGSLDKKFSRINHPKRGDVVLIPTEITEQPLEGLGICLGTTIAMIGEAGLEFLPLSAAAAAWDVTNAAMTGANDG